MGFAVSFWLSRQNIDLFADFSVLIILSTLFATVATLGFDVLLIRELSGKSRFDDVSKIDLIGFCAIASTLISIFVSYVMWITIGKFYSSMLVVGYPRIFAAILFQCCCRLIVPILRIRAKFVAAQLVESVLQQAMIVILIVIFIVPTSKISQVFDCFIVGTLATAAFGIFKIGSDINKVKLVRPIKLHRIRYFSLEGGLFLGSALLLMMNSRIDILYLGAMISPDAFGAYRVASQVFELSGVVSSTFLATYGPRIAIMLREGDKFAVRDMLLTPTRMNFMLMVVGSIIFALIGRPFVLAIFPAFQDLYGLVLIFLTFRALSLLFPSGSTLLDLADHQRLSLASVAVSLMVAGALLPIANLFANAHGVAILVGTVLVARSYIVNRLAIRHVGIGPTVWG